jgi:acyl transferase domain-containing protein
MEMGPGRALSSLAQANGVPAGQVIPALRHPEQRMADDAWHVASIARLWACGVAVDWAPIWGGARRNRVPLPTYAFQKKPYFIEPGIAAAARRGGGLPERIADLGHWGWKPHWRPATAGFDLDDLAETAAGNLAGLCRCRCRGRLGRRRNPRLRAAGHRVVTVRAGDAFARDGERGYLLCARTRPRRL